MAYFNARRTAKAQAALQEAAGMTRALLLAFQHQQPEHSPSSVITDQVVSNCRFIRLNSGKLLLQGLRCQASSVLVSTALQQLSHPLVRDCCATVAATAGALVLVKLAEVLTYKGLIDQVCPNMRACMVGIPPLANAHSNAFCMALLEKVEARSSLYSDPITDVLVL